MGRSQGERRGWGVCPLTGDPPSERFRTARGRWSPAVSEGLDNAPLHFTPVPQMGQDAPCGLGGLQGWGSRGLCAMGSLEPGSRWRRLWLSSCLRAGTLERKGQGAPNPAAGRYCLGLPPSAVGKLRPRARKPTSLPREPPGHRSRPAAIWGRVSRAAFPSGSQCDVTATDQRGSGRLPRVPAARHCAGAPQWSATSLGRLGVLYEAPSPVWPVPHSLMGRRNRVLCARTLGLGLGAVASSAFPSGHRQRVPCAHRSSWFTTGPCVPAGSTCLGPHHAN